MYERLSGPLFGFKNLAQSKGDEVEMIEVGTRERGAAPFVAVPSNAGRRGATTLEGEVEGPGGTGEGTPDHRAPRARNLAPSGKTRVRVDGEHNVGAMRSRGMAKRQASLLRSGEYDYERPRRGDIREGVILSDDMMRASCGHIEQR